MKSEWVVGVVLVATVAALVVVVFNPPRTALAEEAVESPTSLLSRIEVLEEEIRVLRAERDLLKRENARLVKAEKDRLAPEPVAKPDDKPAGKTPGKTYFVPDRDEVWWTDLAAFARDMERRVALGKGDPDQALLAWLARLGGLAGTEVEWEVRAKDFSIQSILPEHCLKYAAATAEYAARPRPAFAKDDGTAETAYNSAVQAAWAKAAKSHGARRVNIQAGPCAILMLLPVDALLEKGGDFKIVGRIVAARGREGGLEMFVDGTVEASPAEKPVAN